MSGECYIKEYDPVEEKREFDRDFQKYLDYYYGTTLKCSEIHEKMGNTLHCSLYRRINKRMSREGHVPSYKRRSFICHGEWLNGEWMSKVDKRSVLL